MKKTAAIVLATIFLAAVQSGTSHASLILESDVAPNGDFGDTPAEIFVLDPGVDEVFGYGTTDTCPCVGGKRDEYDFFQFTGLNAGDLFWLEIVFVEPDKSGFNLLGTYEQFEWYYYVPASGVVDVVFSVGKDKVSGNYQVRLNVLPIAEPATMATFGLGISMLGFMRRRRKAA